ncbi:MAG: hypothetical protein VST66_04875 [Nitrospirota bacterium]|nr:hypothetical protein [Nitrospirota bacterium]
MELAQQENIAVLVNRPLNAIPANRGGIVRLADPQAKPVGTTFEPQQKKVATLEEEYRREFAPSIPHSGQDLPPKDYFSWADELLRIRSQIQSLEHWDQIESQMVAPHLNQITQVLTRHFTSDKAESWQSWMDRYLPELLTLLGVMRSEAGEKSRTTTKAINNLIDPLLPETHRNAPLSRKALWVLTSTPGVTVVLNGMRKPDYVDDSLAILSLGPLPNARRVYEAMDSRTAFS